MEKTYSIWKWLEPPCVRIKNEFIAFTWSAYYPTKELEIWLYKEMPIRADWLLVSHEEKYEEGSSNTVSEIIYVIWKYLNA